MARLRKPSSAEPPIFIPPTTTRSTRSSPNKTVRESPSTRELRYTSSQDPQDAILVPKASTSTSPVRKQRVLRPVASNSRLLRKLSDESLAATPDRKERRGLTVGAPRNYLYSKTLAKSVAKKQAVSRKIGVEAEVETVVDVGTVVDEEVEKSIICGEDERVTDDGDKENTENVEDDEDEDDEPVVASRQRRRQPQARRRVVSDTEEEESEEEEYCTSSQGKGSTLDVIPESAMTMPPPPTSMRSPHRKGHSMISNWAQEVVDLTSSPEPPASFELQPPTRIRTASFAASSRPTSSASNDADAMLHLYVDAEAGLTPN